MPNNCVFFLLSFHVTYNHYIIEYISAHTKAFEVGDMHALVGTVLALQVQGHESDPQNPCLKKASIMACACSVILAPGKQRQEDP